mmetsp:Transcript_37772/g.33796  ORF Transcript_37772/g.33796 Transcript_37772/m.33796 type:complete len:165 (+) Transcript_37772:1-495(+)
MESPEKNKKISFTKHPYKLSTITSPPSLLYPMRFLKNKIIRSKLNINRKPTRSATKKVIIESPETAASPIKFLTPVEPILKTNKIRKTQNTTTSVSIPKYQTKESTLKTKNLVRNYAKAICNFATGPLAQPYIISILKGQNFSLINVKSFMNYACEIKRSVDGM